MSYQFGNNKDSEDSESTNNNNPGQRVSSSNINFGYKIENINLNDITYENKIDIIWNIKQLYASQLSKSTDLINVKLLEDSNIINITIKYEGFISNTSSTKEDIESTIQNTEFNLLEIIKTETENSTLFIDSNYQEGALVVSYSFERDESSEEESFNEKVPNYSSWSDIEMKFQKIVILNSYSKAKKDILGTIARLIEVRRCFNNLNIHLRLFVGNIINEVINDKVDISIRIQKLRFLLESLIAGFHESIVEVDKSIKPDFSLLIQDEVKIDLSGNDLSGNNVEISKFKYDIGKGDSNKINSSHGNVHIPKTINFKQLNTDIILLYIPGFVFLYDQVNLELKIKVSYLNDNYDLSEYEKMINFVSEKNLEWEVLSIFPKIKELDSKDIISFKNAVEDKIFNNKGIFRLLKIIDGIIEKVFMNENFLKQKKIFN